MQRDLSVIGRIFVVLALLAPLGACLPSAGEVTGAGGSSGGGAGGTGGPITCAGGSPGTSDKANWTTVRDVVDITCTGADCHATGDREPYMIGLTGPLSDADLYNKLTTYKAAKCGDRVMVKPCAPEESAFYRAQAGMCEGTAGVALAYMPFGCMPIYDNCTAADLLEGIRQWIAKGAPR
jgi:hypothetical protein